MDPIPLRPQEQLELLENCISRINDIVIITEAGLIDEPGPRIIFVNDAFERQTGYRREEVIGKSPRFLQGPETRREDLAAIRGALERGEPIRRELVNYTKDGEKFWVEIDIAPVSDSSGRLKYLVAVQRDVTARKEGEISAQASELRHLRQRNALISLAGMKPSEPGNVLADIQQITRAAARTLEVARVSIWRCSPDRERIVCMDLYELARDRHSSGAVLQGTDYPAYFQGIAEMEMIAADDAHRHPATAGFSESYLAPLGISSMIDAPIHFGGRAEYVICHEHVGEPRVWTPDEKTFVIAIASHVSLVLEANERTRAEKELLESHQRFQSVASATNDTIWDWNLADNSFWWNDGFARLFGSVSEESGATVHAWIRQIHPEDRDRVARGIFAAVEGGAIHWTDEYRFLRDDGRIAHVLDRGQIIRDAGGRGIRMVGGMTDLTEKKVAQLELARSHRALQMLSSCNELLIREDDENALLKQVCQLATEIGGYRMAWVGYAMEDPECRLVQVAQSGGRGGAFAEIETSWAESDDPAGAGPVAESIRSGKPIFCNDVSKDPAFAGWVRSAGEREYEGLVCLPLSNERRTFGALVLFAAKSHSTGADELELLRQLANDLAFGIGNLRSRAERHRTLDVVLQVARAVSSGVGVEFFDLLTRNMVEALDADGGWIGRYDPANDSIHMFSFFLNGEKTAEISYALAGTPCMDVANGHVCIHPREVRRLFPADRALEEYDVEAYAGIPLFDSAGRVCGIMGVFFHQPLKQTALVESTLTIFAARAASELERQQADAEHKKLEQQFLRAQRLESIGTLASGIAHDMNNILAPVSMAIELLKMGTPDARTSELLDTIAASAKRGTDMIGLVISFARGMEGRREGVQLRPLILEAEKILRDTFLKEIRFQVDAAADLWVIQGDPTQLHQVLLNLCVNARDAVACNGEISILAENFEVSAEFAAVNLGTKPGPYVCIQVSDNGSGISPEIIDKIFDPFFTTKSIGKGTGLGLSTSLAIIKGHGGFILADSEPGQGSRFRVFLPASALRPPASEAVELLSGNSQTILIVDDEELIRKITRETLEAFGYRTRQAADGAEALEIYARDHREIDVVLSDMMMPGMSGTRLIERLKQINPAVLILATSGIPDNEGHARAAGVRGFLPKPCSAEMLLKCLREILSPPLMPKQRYPSDGLTQ